MSHQPKWRALIAHDADALSESGKARIQRHLDGCEVCSRALAEIRAFESVARDTRETPVEVEWTQMELALRREARTQSQAFRAAKRRRSWRGPALALVAAAAIATVVIWQTREPTEEIAAPVEVEVEEDALPEAPAPEPALALADALEGRVVAVAGSPRRGAELLALGDLIGEGDRLEVVAQHAVHATLGPSTAIALIGAATLTAHTLRENRIALELEEGRVSSVVEQGTPFTIVAAPYEVHAVGTRFRVERSEGVVTVTLEEGSVEVTRDGERVARLDAPAQWSSDPGTRAPDASAVATPSLDPERTLALQLPTSARFLHWQVGKDSLPGGGPGALLLAPGEHEILGFDAEGNQYATTLTLIDEGASLDERALERIRTEPVVGYLPPEQIEETVRPTISRLRSCYERDLRRTDPNLGGSYTLRVRVARNGSVRRVTVTTDDDLPHTLRNCLVRHASAWQFPPPEGGPVTFDLPLNLRTR